MELHFFLEQLDGQRRELVHPVSFSLVRSADTPADSLKAEFMVPDAQDWEQEIARIELQADGRRLFRGICDRQIVGLDSAGCRLTVWARSDAAVLLDNEAIPQEYSCVTLDEMFAKHLAPYGFQSDLEGEGSLLGFQLPGRARRTISSGQAVSAVSRTVRRSEVISQVLLRDELGRYSTALENEAARGLQILRRRCMIPGAQWANAAQDARLKMQQSMRERIQWEIELPRLVDWELGDQVSGELSGLAFRGNIVYQELRFSGQGESSLLILE